MRALIAVAALIDDEGAAQPIHVDLVGAEQIDDLDCPLACRIENGAYIEAAWRRDEAEIEARHASSGAVQHIEAIPGDGRLDRAHPHRGLGGKGQHRCPVGPRQRCLTEDHHRSLGAFKLFHESMRAVGDLGERLGAGAEIIVSIGQIGILADQPNGHFALSSGASA